MKVSTLSQARKRETVQPNLLRAFIPLTAPSRFAVACFYVFSTPVIPVVSLIPLPEVITPVEQKQTAGVSWLL